MTAVAADPDTKVFLNQIETGRLLGVSRNTIRKWTHAGLLPTFVDPDSGRVLYPRPALMRWAAEFEAKRGAA